MSIEASFHRANQICNRQLTNLEERDLSLSILYWGFMPAHFDNALHRHSFFEACYVVDGSGLYIEHGTEYPLSKGTSFLSLPGIWHQIRSLTGLSLAYVAFEVDEDRSGKFYIDAYRRLIEHAQPVIDGADKYPAGHFWETLISIFDDQKIPMPALLKYSSISLMLSILSLHGPDPADTFHHQPDTEFEENMLFRQAKLFINDNLSEELTLKTVANHLHISPRHLTRLFQNHTTQTFVHYIQKRRIQLASQLLLDGDLSIKDIACQCGFQSVHYFTRIFTQKLGVSPGRFRRSQLPERRS
ncbi:AraC family transcriptional regulator [Paenibacillus sp.]|jgi:AraC family L-rhamnose operon transcriptional activator RhaR|uniref:helix-turn-helix transcriptional regulator n=1 Tax=Paenibacillus sp. TaxID=58172 RepID=UPI002819D99D|nr:AraC family transcriptional regulator [Paenibacillus sp.]MDR0268688.1 AraC family transcriptional regulator [Paenibacillus sp.]